MRALRRAFFALFAFAWGLSFAAATWVNFSVSGSILPPGPVDAHDLDDLVVWTLLTAWIYVTPVFLVLAYARLRSEQTAPDFARDGAIE